jgi:hypothetical protein
MQTPLAQIVALTCYGNAVIHGFSVPRFLPDNSTCQFCESVEFLSLAKSAGGSVQETVAFSSPDEWFADIRKRGVSGMRLMQQGRNDPRISDRMSSGFVGGGRIWNIEVMLKNGTSEFWASRWAVGNKNAPDRKCWRVSYGLVLTARTESRNLQSLKEIKTCLQQTLKDILVFSDAHKSRHFDFSSSFANALIALDDHRVDIGYHKDLYPVGTLTDNAESLLKAAMSAWVFGGMGSWNDMSFKGQEQADYEHLSDNLFSILSEAIEASATSSMYGN